MTGALYVDLHRNMNVYVYTNCILLYQNKFLLRSSSSGLHFVRRVMVCYDVTLKLDLCSSCTNSMENVSSCLFTVRRGSVTLAYLINYLYNCKQLEY